ncbi:cytochrome c oxidase assembly protein [Prosthecomicrobium sp. N25]|uniref:cytochrome c oxidase assembly protein n=1 Tax=Prosthecomicrobium sp. N25 TaxID=3129254 RepID=UPI0030788177
MTEPRPADPAAARHRTVALACAALVAGMTGAAFAAVPFYDWFCRVTGYGGTTQVAAAAPGHVIDRAFEIRFDANVNGIPWRFRPEGGPVTVKAGEVATANYVIENLSDTETLGVAAYNVTPELAGYYFTKLVCFCFTEQKLAPRETVVVPVTFYVDPSIDQDRNLRSIRTITLSYTFFPAKSEKSKPVADAGTRKTPEKL